MKTPDTEWQEEIKNGTALGVPGSERVTVSSDWLAHLLTSRDTYWKERVEETREKTRNEVLSRLLLIISAKALNETWNAERQLERVENFCKNPSWGIAETGNMMLPITNEDNLK